MPEPTRREALQSLGALAGARWAAEGFDPDDEPHESRTSGAAGWVLTELEGMGLITSIESCCVDLSLMDRDDFETTRLGVYYEGDTVNLNVDGKGGDPYTRGGSLATLDPDQARETAVALFMAAEELDSYGDQ